MTSSPCVPPYGWQTLAGPHSCAYLVPKVIAILKALGVKRVLDIGCGNGALCAALYQEGFQPVGIEYDAQGFRLATTTYPHIPFYKLSLEDNGQELLAAEGAFDAAVSTEVIEHLYSPHLLPRFANGLLKPSGYCLISTPYHGYLKNLALSLLNQWDRHHTPLWHGGHIKFWSRKTLTTLLETHGFRVCSFYGVGRLPYLWKSMLLLSQKPSF